MTASNREYEEGAGAVAVLGYCLAVFLVSRILLELIGVGARELAYPVMQAQYHRAAYSPSVWLDIWGVWDTEWFLGIAENGYDTAVRSMPGVEGQANWAFYPLFPMLARYGATLFHTDTYLAMLAISNFAFAAALPFIWYETRHFYGQKAANIAVVLFAFVPGSFVFSCAYSESLFLVFIVISLALMRRERWLLAGLAVALATLTRNFGILLVIPMAVHAWQSRPAARPTAIFSARNFAIVAAMALPAAALAGFMVFLWRHTGDPLAFATVQGAWKRDLQNPFVTLVGPLVLGGKVQAEIVPSIAMAWVSVGAAIILVRRRNWPHAAFMIAAVTITLASGVLSYFRLFLTMAPGVMALAGYFAARPRTWSIALGLFATANGFMMASWALGLGIY